MRVMGEIAHPDCKITLYAWNNRYIVKFEQGLLEQTFKINEYDVTSEADLRGLIDENFIQETLSRFESMSKSLDDRFNAID